MRELSTVAPARPAATIGARIVLALLVALPGLSGCSLVPGDDDASRRAAADTTTAVTATPDPTGTTGTTGTTGNRAGAAGPGAGPGPTRAAVLRTIGGLAVAERAAPEPYRRARFDEDWADDDRDCRNTRAEVLLRDSDAPVTFRPNGCTVDRGSWTDPWNGTSSPLAATFQIDHTVPLANAWVAGAWAWSDEQRRRFANDLDDPDALVALEGSNNSTKGDKTPDQWRPPLRTAWCRYAAAWSRIKQTWSLSVTEPERASLVELAGTCDA